MIDLNDLKALIAEKELFEGRDDAADLVEAFQALDRSTDDTELQKQLEDLTNANTALTDRNSYLAELITRSWLTGVPDPAMQAALPAEADAVEEIVEALDEITPETITPADLFVTKED